VVLSGSDHGMTGADPSLTTKSGPVFASTALSFASVVTRPGVSIGACYFLKKPWKMSIGTGKMTVVFFSTPISVRVCKYRS
jgi:hypothetical protein